MYHIFIKWIYFSHMFCMILHDIPVYFISVEHALTFCIYHTALFNDWKWYWLLFANMKEFVLYLNYYNSENNEEAWVFNRQVFIAAPGTPPRYVIAKALNPRTVEVSWLPPEKPNGVIQVVAISHIKNTRIFYNYGIFFFLIICGFFPPDICFDQNSKIIFSLYQ